MPSVVSGGDVADIIVTIFALCRPFRDTSYFRSLLDTGIGSSLYKYADTSLSDLLADLGAGLDDPLAQRTQVDPPAL